MVVMAQENLTDQNGREIENIHKHTTPCVYVNGTEDDPSNAEQMNWDTDVYSMVHASDDFMDVCYDTPWYGDQRYPTMLVFRNAYTDEKIFVEAFEDGGVGVRSSKSGYIASFDGPHPYYEHPAYDAANITGAACDAAKEYMGEYTPIDLLDALPDDGNDKERVDDDTARWEYGGEESMYSLRVDRDVNYCITLTATDDINEKGDARVAYAERTEPGEAMDAIETLHDESDALFRVASGTGFTVEIGPV